MKTEAYQEMTTFFSEVVGLPVDFQEPDFAVLRLPGGDKLEIFGPSHKGPPEQFARNQVVFGLLVEDMDEAVEQLRTAGIELVGDRQSGGSGYFWQHFRGPDGKIFELVCDPAHP